MVKKNGKIWKTISVVMALALIVSLLPTGFLGLTTKVEAAIQDDSGSITVFTENFENSDTTYYTGSAKLYNKWSDSDVTPMNTYVDEDGNTVSGSGGSWALRATTGTNVTAALTDEWDGDGDDDGKSLKLTSTSTSDSSYYTYITRISSDFLTDAAKERLKNGTSSALDTITLSYDFKTVSTATASTAAYHTVYSGLFGYTTGMWSTVTTVYSNTAYSIYSGNATAYGRSVLFVPTTWYKATTLDDSLTKAIETTADGEQYVQGSAGINQFSTYAYYDSVTYDSGTGEITAEGTFETTGTLKYIDGYYYVGVTIYYANKYATTYIDNITVTYSYQNKDSLFSDLEESGEWQNIITPYTEDAIEEAYNEGTIKSTVYSSDVDDALLSAGCTDYSTGSFENGDWTMILTDGFWELADTSASYTFGTWYKNSSGSTMAHWGNYPTAGAGAYYVTTVDSMFAGDYETNVKAYSYSASTAYSSMWVVAKLDIDEETGLGDGQYKLTPEGYSILGKVENSGSYASSALTQQYGTYSGYKNGNMMFSLSQDYENVVFGYYVVSNSASANTWGCLDDCYLIGYREDGVSKLISVEEPDDVSVGMGFSDDEVLEALPDEIEITLTDPDYSETWTEERELTWDLSAVKTSAVGSYTATYTYESENGAVQSGSITVTVEYFDVTSTSEIDEITVYVGATGKEIWAALPTFTIDVTSSYGDMSKEETLDLTWKISTVDTSAIGDYTATYTYTSSYAGTKTGTITVTVTDILSDRAYIDGVATGETGDVEVAMSSDADYPDGTFEIIDLPAKTLVSSSPKTNGFASSSLTYCKTSSEYAHGGSNSARFRIENYPTYDLGYVFGYTVATSDTYKYFHLMKNNDIYGYIELNAEDEDNITWTQETFKFTATAETMIVALGCYSSLTNGSQSNVWGYLYDLTVGTEYTVSYWHTGYITKSSGAHYFYIDDITVTYEGDITTTLYYDYAGTYTADTVRVNASVTSDVATEAPEYVTADLVIEDNDYIKEGDGDYTTTQKIPVTWDEESLAKVNEAISNVKVGTYTITGTAVYDGKEIAVETTVTVYINDYSLVSASEVNDITVAIHTSSDDVKAALVSTIDIVSEYEEDTQEETLALTWDLSGVDTETAGSYTATYEYTSLYYGPQSGSVTVNVEYYDLTSVSKVYGTAVETGASEDDILAKLVSNVDVTSVYAGDTKSETLELVWDLSGVDTSAEGEYTATYTYTSEYAGTQTGTVTVKVTEVSSDKAYIDGVGTGVIETTYLEWADGYTDGTFEDVALSNLYSDTENCLRVRTSSSLTYVSTNSDYAHGGSNSARLTASADNVLYCGANATLTHLTYSYLDGFDLSSRAGDSTFKEYSFTFTPSAEAMYVGFNATTSVVTRTLIACLYNLDTEKEYTVTFWCTGYVTDDDGNTYVYIDDVEIKCVEEETTTLYYDYAGAYTVDNGTTVDEGEDIDISNLIPICVTADLVLEDNAYVSADTEEYDYTTTQNLPVTWDASSIAAVNTSKPGEYTITGTAVYAGEEIAVTALVTVAEAHQYEAVVTEPTCVEQGYTTYTCSICGDTYVDDYTDATGVHTYETTVTPATLYSDGVIVTTCSVCGDVESTVTIPKIASVSLSGTSFTYTGSAIEPDVTVTDIEGNVVSSEYYTVTYSGNTAAGAATVTVTFTGNYSGTVTESFTITAADNGDDTDNTGDDNSDVDDTNDNGSTVDTDDETDDSGSAVIVITDDSGLGSSSDSDTGSDSSSISPKTGDVVSVFTLELILVLALAAMIMSVKKTRKALKELL